MFSVGKITVTMHSDVDGFIGEMLRVDCDVSGVPVSYLLRMTEQGYGRHRGEAVAMALNSRRDYERAFKECGPPDPRTGEGGTEVYLADEDDLSFLSRKPVRGGSVVDFIITQYGAEHMRCSGICQSCNSEGDHYRVVIQPMDINAKRVALTDSRNGAWLDDVRGLGHRR